MIDKNKLTLYHFASCPFCIRVRQFLLQEEIVIKEKDILLDPEAKRELKQIGGKTQVPCLVIDGEPLYESADIIQWFINNEDQLK